MTSQFRLSAIGLWLILCLPGFAMIAGAASSPDLEKLLHPSGEFSARFMIIAMMATPLTMWLPGWRGPRWLLRNRRYFGVAAGGYALLHTIVYVIDRGGAGVITEMSELSMAAGWAAFVIFVPLLITSNNQTVRRLGKKWKTLQRLVYYAAVLTLLHWAALHDWGGVGPALVHFAPLAAAAIYRLGWRRRVINPDPS